mmetsp:Transcript_2659/g.6115  ORF Transcript_2659/g.6115 Transcript_2659/m.6115 type:complete len:329 (-) Transcript_2659:164-1150(-)
MEAVAMEAEGAQGGYTRGGGIGGGSRRRLPLTLITLLLAAVAMLCAGPGRLRALGGGTNRTSRYKKGPRADCKSSDVPSMSKKLVPHSMLPRNWTKAERRGYYAFLDRGLMIHRKGASGRYKKLSVMQAIKNLTRIYEDLDINERTLWACQYTDPWFSYFRHKEDERDMTVNYYRFCSENKVRRYKLGLVDKLGSSFFLDRLPKILSRSPLRPDFGNFTDRDGRDIPLDRRIARRASLKNFYNWTETCEHAERFKPPPLPELTTNEVDQIIKYVSNKKDCLANYKGERRKEAFRTAQKIAQIALQEGSLHMAYKMYGTLDFLRRWRLH